MKKKGFLSLTQISNNVTSFIDVGELWDSPGLALAVLSCPLYGTFVLACAPEVNVIKLFSCSLLERQSKLECLSLASFYKLV